MRAVGIKILKNRLSEYVRLAASGETVLVLDRERVVAELNPPAPTRPLNARDAWMAQAEADGWLTRPTLPRTGPPPSFPRMKLAELLADLAESRADRDLP